MASNVSPASTIAPHLAPVLHTFATADLDPILARSGFTSLADLLSPFEHGVERVTIRNSAYEPTTVPRFSVHFVDRQLPASFGLVQGGTGTGAGAGRARNGSVGTPGSSLGHLSGSVHDSAPATPPTPFQPPSQGERDELFLDSLARDRKSVV